MAMKSSGIDEVMLRQGSRRSLRVTRRDEKDAERPKEPTKRDFAIRLPVLNLGSMNWHGLKTCELCDAVVPSSDAQGDRHLMTHISEEDTACEGCKEPVLDLFAHARVCAEKLTPEVVERQQEYHKNYVESIRRMCFPKEMLSDGKKEPNSTERKGQGQPRKSEAEAPQNDGNQKRKSKQRAKKRTIDLEEREGSEDGISGFILAAKRTKRQKQGCQDVDYCLSCKDVVENRFFHVFESHSTKKPSYSCNLCHFSTGLYERFEMMEHFGVAHPEVGQPMDEIEDLRRFRTKEALRYMRDNKRVFVTKKESAIVAEMQRTKHKRDNG